MIIREIIMWLSIMRHNLQDFPEVGNDNKIKALGFAIDYIKKYQMIKEITDNWVLLPDSTVLDFKDVRKIKEIIEADKADMREVE